MVKRKKMWSVDIQHTEEFTYQVEAATAEEAENKAMLMYTHGRTATHEEIVGDPTVTNTEEIA